MEVLPCLSIYNCSHNTSALVSIPPKCAYFTIFGAMGRNRRTNKYQNEPQRFSTVRTEESSIHCSSKQKTIRCKITRNSVTLTQVHMQGERNPLPTQLQNQHTESYLSCQRSYCRHGSKNNITEQLRNRRRSYCAINDETDPERGLPGVTR